MHSRRTFQVRNSELGTRNAELGTDIGWVGGYCRRMVIALSPFLALIAGILILLMPRLLNYIVAIYLIVVGLVGLFHL